jgi:hypothetical protein
LTQQKKSCDIAMAFPYNNAEVPFSMASQAPPARLEDPLAAVQRCLNQPRSPLLVAFFSTENVDILQNRLRATIQHQTARPGRGGILIDRQSDTDLVVIMRRVYEDHANNSPDNVAAEVTRLNNIVLSIVVPMVATNVAAHLAYLRDASRLPEPIPRGLHTSVKGSKTFELFRGL